MVKRGLRIEVPWQTGNCMLNNCHFEDLASGGRDKPCNRRGTLLADLEKRRCGDTKVSDMSWELRLPDIDLTVRVEARKHHSRNCTTHLGLITVLEF
jgi:hypothetical protein